MHKYKNNFKLLHVFPGLQDGRINEATNLENTGPAELQKARETVPKLIRLF